MVNAHLLARNQSITVVGLLLIVLISFNLFVALKINFTSENILDLPRNDHVKLHISDTTRSLGAAIATTNRSKESNTFNEKTVNSPRLSVPAIHHSHQNATISAQNQKSLTSTAPISSDRLIRSTTDARRNPAERNSVQINVQVNRIKPVKLPTPIFIASLPKSATTSMSHFFHCGGYKVADHAINGTLTIGQCYEKNIQNGRPPFEGCGDASVWSDTGHMEESGQCYLPSVDGLEALYESYPNATVILMTRPTDSWYSSIERYIGGMVKQKMILCDATGFPGLNATSSEWKNMYEWHQERVRTFARLHPSITFLEFSVDDPQIAQKLESSTSIGSSCWKVVNANKKDLDLKKASHLIHNQKAGTMLPIDFRNLKPMLSPALTQIRNLDQVTGPKTASIGKKLPTPIFVAGMPHMDLSNRINDFFTCGGYKSTHHWTQLVPNKKMRIGECFQNNVNHRRPPLEGCGDSEVWTETGYAKMDGQCYHPSVDGLEAFRQAYPNGTVILFRRLPLSWFRHLKANHTLRRNLEQCNTTYFPGRPASQEEWIGVHNWYETYVRLTGYQYPSLTYLEFPLHDLRLSKQLEEVIGVNASCWNGF